jgi:NAD(P)-dependent dehydrogenase (short-subunit alcohol dehydrogenase family)
VRIDLTGRRAFVTGGSRGIGLAIVEALARCGADTTFNARTARSVDVGLKALPPGLRVRGEVCDVTDFEGMSKLLAHPIDILVNNAGVIGPIGRIADVDTGEWAETHRVNVASAFNAVRLALPGLIERHGTIVNLSSGAAFNAMEGWSAYCSSKAALAMLTRSIHLEYGGFGVRAFGFAPGLVDTDMQSRIRESGVNPVSAIPRSKLAPASEPARAIVWLCTCEADDLVGQELDVRTPALRARCGLAPLA